MGLRGFAYGVSFSFLALVAAPGFWDADEDGFPLSTYPMFAHARPRVNDVTGAVAVLPDGRRVTVPPRFVGNSEAMLAVATLRGAVAEGPRATRRLCAEIAERMSHTAEGELAGARQVEIATQRVDAIDFLGGRVPASVGRVHARCKVQAANAARVRPREGR